MAKIHFTLGLYVLLQVLDTCLSLATANMCLECARNPNMCRRISGLFTVTVLTEGTYNPVVEIPAPACSINITEFRSSSNYIAVKTASGQGIINSYWGLGQPGQYYGAGVRFSYDKNSGSCKGTCINSEGPTTEAVVVQILYYDKNPGIAYEFILPNSVAFTPFDGTLSKQNSARKEATTTTTTTTQRPQIRFQQPRRESHHRRHRHREFPEDSSTEGSEFRGEYYTGTQYSRSEGRPDETSALESQHSSSSSSVPQSQPSHDYTGTRYGSHTLGGRGMSYTYAADSHSRRRDHRARTAGRRIVSRIRTPEYHRPQVVRTVASPQYVSQSESSSYGAQPRYQSFSAASTSYFNGNNAIEQFDGSNYLKTFNGRQTSLGRGQSLGNNEYGWKISGLTECSKTCGGGIQRTNIVCISQSSRTQVVVTPENCANSIKPGAQTVECNTSPCEPAWEADEWSDCSVTCGSGTQTRTVECRQRFSSSLVLSVSADQCGLSAKPAIAQQCEKGLCTQWLTGTWSECSRGCGGGERRRSVRCADRYESQVPNEYCTDPAPSDSEPCNTQPCNVEWWMSDWSAECSESCGQGYRSRTAVCMNDRGEVTDGLCDKRDLPSTQEVCRSDAGCHGTWFAGAWSKCSANCGEGTKSRQVVCLGRTASALSIVSNEECDADLKPETEESCVNTQCDAQWYTSSWSECSATCGEGYQTREVRCIENNQRPSRRCIGSLKPDSKQKCSLSSCLSRYQSNQYQGTNRYDANSGYSSYSEDTREEPEEYSRDEDDNDNVTADNDEHGSTKDDQQGPSDSSEDHSSSTDDKSCTDEYWNCLMVLQARLCKYDYYRSLCCRSCRKA